MKTRFAVPFLVFFMVVIVLQHGLFLHPNQIASPLIQSKST